LKIYLNLKLTSFGFTKMTNKKRLSHRILIVDDEKDIADGIQYNLCHEGFNAITCYSGKEAIDLTRNHEFSLILLDIMLPDITGLKVLNLLRERGFSVPIILLTAKSQIEDKVLGLDLGADDYLTKPFGIDELLARIKAVLRRSSNSNFPKKKLSYSFPGLTIDFKSFQIINKLKTSQLSNFEAQILNFLLDHLNEVVTRDQLLKEVWGYTTLPTTRTIDNHIARLRKKVEVTPEEPIYIKTIHGIGYKFEAKESL
jgi:DNA-binding response OmpR family regulator